MSDQDLETHPHLPSGPWEGFYRYNFSRAQHSMSQYLDFSRGRITGFGTDDVAIFNWDGTYDPDSGKVFMVKRYATHKVWYKGHFDENGIWGIWEIFYGDDHTQPGSLMLTGDFHIWPKGDSRDTAAEETVSEQLQQILATLN
jgi:hypothetical protein